MMANEERFDGPLRIEKEGVPIRSLEEWRDRGKPAGGVSQPGFNGDRFRWIPNVHQSA